MTEPRDPLLSIVTPCFNESEGISEMARQVREFMADRLPSVSYEHVFVDNASTDSTLECLFRISETDSRVVIVANPRNVGVHRSFMNGVHHARGDAVVNIMADLQTPLEVLPELVASWQAGYPSAIAIRRTSEIGAGRSILNRFFYRTMLSLGRPPLEPGFVGYGLYSGPVLDFIKQTADPEPFLRGIVMEAGFPCRKVYYAEPVRLMGRSKSGARKDLRFGVFALVTHSRLPASLSLALSVLWLLLGLIAIATVLLLGRLTPTIGWLLVGAFAVWILGLLLMAQLSLLVAMAALLVEYAKSRPLSIAGSLLTERRITPPRAPDQQGREWNGEP